MVMGISSANEEVVGTIKPVPTLPGSDQKSTRDPNHKENLSG